MSMEKIFDLRWEEAMASTASTSIISTASTSTASTYPTATEVMEARIRNEELWKSKEIKKWREHKYPLIARVSRVFFFHLADLPSPLTYVTHMAYA